MPGAENPPNLEDGTAGILVRPAERHRRPNTVPVVPLPHIVTRDYFGIFKVCAFFLLVIHDFVQVALHRIEEPTDAVRRASLGIRIGWLVVFLLLVGTNLIWHGINYVKRYVVAIIGVALLFLWQNPDLSFMETSSFIIDIGLAVAWGTSPSHPRFFNADTSDGYEMAHLRSSAVEMLSHGRLSHRPPTQDARLTQWSDHEREDDVGRPAGHLALRN